MDGSYHIDTALRGYVDRIVNLHQDRDAVNGDIREVYGEAKDAGFNVTILRGMVKENRMEPEARDSLYQLQHEYRIKLGMLAGTPLGDAAEERSLRPTPPEDDEPMSGQGAPMVARPKPLAEQPLHRGRGRPRKADAGSKPMFDA
jgi:uncharacterized protein (UPF0335 family)